MPRSQIAAFLFLAERHILHRGMQFSLPSSSERFTLLCAGLP